MDSLLVNYASSDEEDEQQQQEQQSWTPHVNSSGGSLSLSLSLSSPNTISSSSSPSLRPPKPTFNLPPPQRNSTKRLIEFKPPFKSALPHTEEEEEEEEEVAPPPKRSYHGSGGLTALLPPPKNTLALGGGGGGGGTRCSMLESPPPAPLLWKEDESASGNSQFYCGATPQYVGAFDYNASNYSAADEGSIEASWSHGEPQPKVQVQVQVPLEGRNGRSARKEFEAGCDVIEIKQEELMSKRPRQDQVNLTGIAFGPSYKPVSAAKDKPSKLHKRKHQIGSLYYDLKQKEIELAERRARGQLTKSETHAKYGW